MGTSVQLLEQVSGREGRQVLGDFSVWSHDPVPLFLVQGSS